MLSFQETELKAVIDIAKNCDKVYHDVVWDTSKPLYFEIPVIANGKWIEQVLITYNSNHKHYVLHLMCLNYPQINQHKCHGLSVPDEILKNTTTSKLFTKELNTLEYAGFKNIAKDTHYANCMICLAPGDKKCYVQYPIQEGGNILTDGIIQTFDPLRTAWNKFMETKPTEPQKKLYRIELTDMIAGITSGDFASVEGAMETTGGNALIVGDVLQNFKKILITMYEKTEKKTWWETQQKNVVINSEFYTRMKQELITIQDIIGHINFLKIVGFLSVPKDMTEIPQTITLNFIVHTHSTSEPKKK